MSNDHVSLYSLQPVAGLHRDVLQHLCRRSRISIHHVPVSTPRYRVRVISPDDVPTLIARAKAHPRRRNHREAS